MASVKLVLPDDSKRRLRLRDTTFDALVEATSSMVSKGGAARFLWFDEEGDACVITNTAELQEALRLAHPKALMISPQPAAGATQASATVYPGEPVSRGGISPRPVDGADDLTFTLNGKLVSVANPSPRMSLLDYLRGVAGYTGTKSSCRQGGCGACTVVLSPTAAGGAAAIAINACLRPLCAVDGMFVTTTEGIGNARDGYHVVQDKLACGNGSQCGFCSPGMVMSMYSLLQATPHPTAQQIESHFDGNICRCTGYRPILESFRAAFAPPGGAHLLAPDTSPVGCCGSESPVPTLATPKTFESGTGGQEDSVRWVEPTSLQQLSSVLWGAAATQPRTPVRIVAGNTGHGVYDDDEVTLMVNITKIPDMIAQSVTAEGSLKFGGGVSIAQMIRAVEKQQDTALAPGYWAALATHMNKIANVQVRNVGSWAGNLALCHAQPQFQSDLKIEHSYDPQRRIG